MGELYDRMARDLKLKNLAIGTQTQYLTCCRRFAAYHWRSPREMGLEEVKEFLGHLMEGCGSVERLKMHVAGLKFLYGVTLDRPEIAERLPWPKVPHKKPDILSGTETERVLSGMASSVIPSLVLTTAYSAGLRISEACRLRPEDIDSKRMLIHLHFTKGNKERYVMLSERLLPLLRVYYKQVRPPQSEWLFPGRNPKKPISRTAVDKALKASVSKAKLRKRVTPHVLRHSFATHLLETGTDIRVIQALLGHGSIRTTAGYTQVSRRHIASVKSPLDLLGTKDGAVLR
ncbi:MAG: tyrosine-type recombinase/integrase [Betaproteobacteria bacterium]|nr:tyrosine-type recombinase/integrase [Betaproteobacteria bacterium]